jgi:hypothetical protein
MRTRLFFVLALALFCSGCAAQTRYAWDGYDDRLYSYYKTPAESDQFMEGLYEIILEGDAEGRYPEAITWYHKERAKWPESHLLMDKMIALASSRQKSQERPDQRPVPGLEKRP